MNRLSDALDLFRCHLDSDIENFLRYDAIEFISRQWCSVFIIVDEEQFDAGKLNILAYFTLSHKALIPSAASQTKIRETSGFKESSSIHFVLIGHLGKYIACLDDGTIISASVSSQEILDYAFDTIRSSSSWIPCRCALVECNDNEKVHRVYTNYGFKKFQYDGEHHQFYKRI